MASLHRLYQQLHVEDTTTREEMGVGFAALALLAGSGVYVACDGGSVVGSFTLYVLPNLTRNGRKAGLLENVVVDAPHRRQGVGRAMIEEARRLAEEAGCYKLSLTSTASRHEAHAFYRRCGMERHGYSFRFALPA